MGTLPSGRSFVAGEIETAAYLNSLSTAVNFLLNPPRAQVFNSAAQSVNNATFTGMTFDSEQYDSDTIHNPGSFPTRFTPQTPGLYAVSGQISWSSNVTGVRLSVLYLNGVAVAQNDIPTGSGNLDVQVAKEIYCNGSTDYLELVGWQNSGAALNVVAGLANTWFSCRWVANS
jgi:hypothetical protein